MKTIAGLFALIIYIGFWLASLAFSVFVMWAIFHFIVKYW